MFASPVSNKVLDILMPGGGVEINLDRVIE